MSYCPKCGFQSQENSTYCQSCGGPLLKQTQSHPYPRSPVYYPPPPHRGMTSTVKIVIALVIIIGVIGAGSTLAVFEYYSSSLPNRVVAHPVVLAIVYPNQASDGYFGPAYWDTNGGLPLYLSHGQTHTITWTLTNRDATTSHSLDSATTGFSGGFTVQSVTPNLPMTVAGSASIALNFTIRAPDNDYNGPVTIDLFTLG